MLFLLPLFLFHFSVLYEGDLFFYVSKLYLRMGLFFEDNFLIKLS